MAQFKIEIFQQRLKELLEEKGMKYQALQRKLEDDYYLQVSIDTIQSWFRKTDARYPKTDTILILCDLLNVSTDYLFGISEKKETYNLQFITDYTGLSYKAIECLHINKDTSFKDAYNRNHFENEGLSNLLEKDNANYFLHSLTDYMSRDYLKFDSNPFDIEITYKDSNNKKIKITDDSTFLHEIKLKRIMDYIQYEHN